MASLTPKSSIEHIGHKKFCESFIEKNVLLQNVSAAKHWFFYKNFIILTSLKILIITKDLSFTLFLYKLICIC